MSEHTSPASSSNQGGTGGSSVLTFKQTARKRSKSSLLLQGDLSIEERISEVGTANGGSLSSSRPASSQALPTSNLLQQDSTRSWSAMNLGANNSSGSRAMPVRISSLMVEYIADWLVVLVAIIVLVVSEHSAPRVVYIPKSSLSDFNYPLLPNSVPSWSVPVYSILVPAVCMVLHSVVLRRPVLEAHHLILGLATSVLITGAITNAIKAPVGRLRPDFNARCWPDGKVLWEKEDSMGGYAQCTGSVGSVEEGRKSFPSGHSSWSAAGLCYCTWILLDRLQVFGSGSGHPWRLLVAGMPSLAALAVGVSRYHDYWHHATDVAAGLLLGGFVSWLCYRQQRLRLVEVDAVSYGGPMGQAGRSSGGGGVARLRYDEDDTPLLQHPGALPV